MIKHNEYQFVLLFLNSKPKPRAVSRGAEFNKPMEVESQFLKPLKNTDYAVKFIEKYLLIRDLQAKGVAFRPTNNNALALNLIKNINPNRGIGLSVNMLR